MLLHLGAHIFYFSMAYVIEWIIITITASFTFILVSLFISMFSGLYKTTHIWILFCLQKIDGRQAVVLPWEFDALVVLAFWRPLVVLALATHICGTFFLGKCVPFLAWAVLIYFIRNFRQWYILLDFSKYLYCCVLEILEILVLGPFKKKPHISWYLYTWPPKSGKYQPNLGLSKRLLNVVMGPWVGSICTSWPIL